MLRQCTPRRPSSLASERPTGPAPTMSIGVSVTGMMVNPNASGRSAVFFLEQIEAPQHLAIADDEDACLALRAMADPRAGRQSEDVLGLPGDRVVADARRAAAFDDRANHAGTGAQRQGLAIGELDEVAVDQRHDRAAIHRIDIAHAP